MARESSVDHPVNLPASRSSDEGIRRGPIVRWMVSGLRHYLGDTPVRLDLWGALIDEPREGPALVSVRIRSPRVALQLAYNPWLHFGEAYMRGDLDVEGDLLALLTGIYRAAISRSVGRPVVERASTGLTRNTMPRSRANVHHHYDLGNDFYRLWLDRNLVYTCAYFPTSDAPLEEAQEAKLEYVCRKLRLEPGEHVVEAGCGWGALALYMARRHRVKVTAFNISTEQIAYARARARAEGLDRQVEFVEADYRMIDGRYDAFVSIGMLEHVGLARFAALGDVIARVLDPVTGRGLLHFIGRDRPGALNPWIRRRIFPGAYPPTLPEVFTRVFEPHGFSVSDVENLRRHYALTLRQWRARYERAVDTVRAMFDEAFTRAWRLYLAGSEAAFLTGSLQLFQVVFTPRGSTRLPSTRADVYRDMHVGGAAPALAGLPDRAAGGRNP